MITCALIGLGGIAWKYDMVRASHESALSQAGAILRHPGLKLAGGCSPDEADRVSFHTWAPGVKIFADTETMINEIKPDLVGICSPTVEHFNHAKLCLESGVRALWLEKPPTYNPDQLDQLIVLAGEKRAVVLVNYIRRYLDSYTRLRELFLSETFGKCQSIRLLYSPGLARNGVHLLDQLFYLSGADGYELLWVETDGSLTSPSFALRLSTGHLVTAVGSDLSYHTNDISLLCEAGILSILRGGKAVRVELRQENALFPGFYDLHDDAGGLLGNGGLYGYMENALDNLIESMEKKRQPFSNLYSARLSQNLLADILAEAEK